MISKEEIIGLAMDWFDGDSDGEVTFSDTCDFAEQIAKLSAERTKAELLASWNADLKKAGVMIVDD